MSEPAAGLTGESTAFVKIIHPETGNVGEVPESALPMHYRAGWTLLTEENAPPADEGEPPPAPMSEAEAAKARSAKSTKAKSTEE
jgi:hypothetical protein